MKDVAIREPVNAAKATAALAPFARSPLAIYPALRTLRQLSPVGSGSEEGAQAFAMELGAAWTCWESRVHELLTFADQSRPQAIELRRLAAGIRRDSWECRESTVLITALSSDIGVFAGVPAVASEPEELVRRARSLALQGVTISALVAWLARQSPGTFSPADLESLGAAALLHNWHELRTLTMATRSRLRRGTGFPLSEIVGLSASVSMIAHDSRERDNGTGGPGGLFRREMHPAARFLAAIVRLCNWSRADWLAGVRVSPWRNAVRELWRAALVGDHDAPLIRALVTALDPSLVDLLQRVDPPDDRLVRFEKAHPKGTAWLKGPHWLVKRHHRKRLSTARRPVPTSLPPGDRR